MVAEESHLALQPAEPVTPPDPDFYLRTGKRVFDVVASAVGLIVLSPVFFIVALILKISSGGPVFYLQERIGKGGGCFRIVKFRTMTVDADRIGPGITTAVDARITAFGKFLRALKLDEIPQLWNVFKGQMSLVGPRPELPRYVANYTESQRYVLSVRPGITDTASLLYRHEERELALNSDPEEFYRTVLLPHKLELNIQYIQHISFFHDVTLIFRTFLSIFRTPAGEPLQ
jgi:lipopolysaccharide/colanic/teichoic acid biosynthesis glycosyltransferase